VATRTDSTVTTVAFVTTMAAAAGVTTMAAAAGVTTMAAAGVKRTLLAILTTLAEGVTGHKAWRACVDHHNENYIAPDEA
jgi:hypothetical protein